MFTTFVSLLSGHASYNKKVFRVPVVSDTCLTIQHNLVFKPVSWLLQP